MKSTPEHLQALDDITWLAQAQIKGQLDWVSCRARWDSLLSTLMNRPEIDLAEALTMALNLARSQTNVCFTQLKSRA